METWREIVAEMRETSGDETVVETVITRNDYERRCGMKRMFNVGDKVSFNGINGEVIAYVDFLNVCRVRFDNGKVGTFTDDELKKREGAE